MAGEIKIGSFSMSWGGARKSAAGDTYDLKGTAAWDKIVGYQDNFSEEVVTERRAHGLATAYTCINVRGRTIASLPIGIYQERPGEKIFLDQHPAYYPTAHQPNNYMSSANLFLSSMIHSDSWGNSIIGINRNGRGEVNTYDLICPGEWDVQKVNGEAFYKINGEMYASRDVLHFRWWSIDGLMGISPIRQNQMTFGKAFRQNRYSAMALGERPPSVLSYEGQLTPEQRALNQKSWREDLEAGRTPILSGKWQYQGVLIPPGDAEYIETANLTEQQICGIFQMPPSFVQNYNRMTWSNSEQADLTYAKHTITPICRVIEQECNMKLFTEREKKNTYLKFNMNGLLRGDSKARAEFYTAMRNVGGLNGNEIRSYEDMNEYNGGDIFTVQGALIPVDQLREFYAAKVEPTAPPTVKTKNYVNGHTVN